MTNLENEVHTDNFLNLQEQARKASKAKTPVITILLYIFAIFAALLTIYNIYHNIVLIFQDISQSQQQYQQYGMEFSLTMENIIYYIFYVLQPIVTMGAFAMLSWAAGYIAKRVSALFGLKFAKPAAVNTVADPMFELNQTETTIFETADETADVQEEQADEETDSQDEQAVQETVEETK